MIRLDAIASAASGGQTRTVRTLRTCRECGAPCGDLKATAGFCGDTCRKRWNNRRMKRGAEVYDLMMALRFDRKTAKLLGVWRLMCRMTAAFYEEDQAQRDGRQSWRSTRAVLAEKPYLHADVVVRSRRPAKLAS